MSSTHASSPAGKVSNKDKLSAKQLKKLARAEKLIRERGHYKQAERILDDLQSRLRAPYPGLLLQVQGMLYFETRRYQTSREAFETLWQREPNNGVALYHLGRIARKVDRPDLALTLLHMGLERAPEHDLMRPEYIQTLIDLERFEDAKAQIDKQRETTPDNPHMLQLTGEMHRRTKQLPEAVDYYRQALSQLVELPAPRDKSAADAEDTFDIERHEDTLWALLAQLKAAGVQAFAGFGTLLGLVRDGHLLPFDKDVDICIPYNQMLKATECMEKNGWSEIKKSFGMVAPRAFSHPKKGLAVDVFALSFDPDEQAIVAGFIMPEVPWEWNYLMKFPPMDLETTQRPHGPVWELKNPEGFLHAVYGNSWKEPDPYFASFAGEAGLIRFSYLTQCYAYIRCFKYWQAGSFKKMDALLYHMCRHLPDDEVLAHAREVVQNHLADEAKRQEDDDLMDEKDDATVH